MKRRLWLIAPAATIAVLMPVGVAVAQGRGPARADGERVGASGSAGPSVPAPNLPSVGDPSPAGWGSTYEPPTPGSGIDTSKLVPGLTATYGAATGGLFSSPPANPASGYVAESGANHPPSVGEIDIYLASDGHQYYRVVNRSSTGTTYSH